LIDPGRPEGTACKKVFRAVVAAVIGEITCPETVSLEAFIKKLDLGPESRVSQQNRKQGS
jgi:hypothetical protein